jgi:hypothetical protein
MAGFNFARGFWAATAADFADDTSADPTPTYAYRPRVNGVSYAIDSVDTVNNRVALAFAAIPEGTLVLVKPDAGATLPAGLSAATAYWARSLSGSQLALATTNSDTTIVDITDAGTGTSRVCVGMMAFAFDGDADVVPAVNTIDIGVVPPPVGSRVCLAVDTGTVPIGLTAATAYYVRAVSGTTCKLATTNSDTTIVDITGAGSGTVYMVVLDDGSSFFAFTRAGLPYLVSLSNQAGGYCNGDYHFVSTPDGGETLTATLTLAGPSWVYAATIGAADADTFAWQLDGALHYEGTIDPTDYDWAGRVLVPLQYVGAGTWTVTIVFDGTRAVAYLDSVEAFAAIGDDTGYAGQSWWEATHEDIAKSVNWGLLAPETDRPISVAGLTPPGALYATNWYDWLAFAVTVTDADNPLVLLGRTGTDQGIFNIYVNGELFDTWDQYAAETGEVRAAFRVRKTLALAVGLNTVKLEVSASKNAASSDYKCVLDAFYFVDTARTYEQIAADAVQYLCGLVRDDDGGVRIAHDSLKYNQDNDAGYVLMVIALAAWRFNSLTCRNALKAGLQWFVDIQDANGCWHWGYERTDGLGSEDDVSPTATYVPWVSDYYTGLTPAITDIRCIDAAQSIPCFCFWLYSRLNPSDAAWLAANQHVFIDGVDALLANNWDDTYGLVYSSWQYYDAGGGAAWHLYEYCYSAGQVDAWMGLTAAYLLTGEADYLEKADRIRENFDANFWSETLQMYSIGLSGAMGAAKTLEQTLYYPYSQGFCVWCWGATELPHADTAINTLLSFTEEDGFSIKPPGFAESETAFSAFAMMGLQALQRADEAVAYKARIRQYYYESYPDPDYGHGAICFSASYNPYPYGQTSAWSVLGLVEFAVSFAQWPAGLPAPLAESITVTAGHTLVAARMQSGRRRVRRCGDGAADVLEATLRLTAAEYAAWQSFYHDTLDHGTLWWTADWLALLGYDQHAGRLAAFPAARRHYGYTDVAVHILVKPLDDVVFVS